MQVREGGRGLELAICRAWSVLGRLAIQTSSGGRGVDSSGNVSLEKCSRETSRDLLHLKMV